jgi:preprotein translocase subunit SecG
MEQMLNKATVILAALVVALSILLGVSLKSGFEKSAKIAQLQDTIKSVNKAEKVIYKIREVAKDEDCYNTTISDDILKQLRK